ncbi:MAG: PQQ-dependent sugar dehydrogenase [Pseudomonadota bacterium]
MKRWQKVLLGLVTLAVVGIAVALWYVSTREDREPSLVAWRTYCAACHGKSLDGTTEGPALVNASLTHGDSVNDLVQTIGQGVPDTTMAGWEGELTPELIKGLALFVIERRQGFPTIRASYRKEPTETRTVVSQHHTFRLERVAILESRPYSMAYLPRGRLLVAEKVRELSFVDLNGHQGQVIEGTPPVWGTLLSVRGTWLNLGTVLDVELHPAFERNGWIYLSHTDRCHFDCGWPVPATMVRVVRGRILDGKWVDEELIWSVNTQYYTPLPDAVAGGRLAFDANGHVYITVGGKNTYSKLHDLNTPYGKIHRVRDDGTVPEDNPFWVPKAERPKGSTMHTVWSYGHRTGQGLDGHPVTGEVWNTEMGPRGGDEINLIKAGGNYGWPLYTYGLDYNGKRVTIGEDLGLDFPIEATILPIVDLTPAPAVSNFTFHNGTAFTRWKNDLLVGSLKASTLYRMRVDGKTLVEHERLATDFGRIRDVVMGGDGLVYVALEHNETGSVWRLVPQR